MDLQTAMGRVEVQPNGCWRWTGNTDRHGYGRLTVSGKCVRAHRFLYEAIRGDAGETLDHLCRNRACVNPQHLEPITNVGNIMRGFSPPAVNARLTHCCRGHAFESRRAVDGKPIGRRVCKPCDARRQREYKQRLRERTEVSHGR